MHAEVAIADPGVYWVRLEGENAYEGSVGQGVEFDTLTAPPATPSALPLASPPPSGSLTTVPPQLKKQRGKKQRKGHKLKRLRRNAVIVAPR